MHRLVALVYRPVSPSSRNSKLHPSYLQTEPTLCALCCAPLESVSPHKMMPQRVTRSALTRQVLSLVGKYGGHSSVSHPGDLLPMICFRIRVTPMHTYTHDARRFSIPRMLRTTRAFSFLHCRHCWVPLLYYHGAYPEAVLRVGSCARLPSPAQLVGPGLPYRVNSLPASFNSIPFSQEHLCLGPRPARSGELLYRAAWRRISHCACTVTTMAEENRALGPFTLAALRRADVGLDGRTCVAVERRQQTLCVGRLPRTQSHRLRDTETLERALHNERLSDTQRVLQHLPRTFLFWFFGSLFK
ncbi:hypothetical protein FVE85_9748 [Porphyridium purpureum]|uniref:Uncharacterized protein n=1 Tax=Porphyridium purpureum TaxID=35688 RepID=A0A5J4YJS4_PORPP|nr:hypothetical protein FVE85_9748 [Porphyridium purpureum]|eukprot:POR5890..scf246_12